ncbi:MAG: class I SAM-dependent methyltransferase, partial [Minisyncoccia bacterium]
QMYLPKETFLLEHFQNHETNRHSYLTGLAVDCFVNPKNDRNSHYFARELFWSKRPKSALKEFARHLTLGGWAGERGESLIFMGDAYGQLNLINEQIECYNQAFYLDSSRREPFMRLAHFYLSNKNYQAAVAYAKGALEIPWSSFYANNKAYYEQEPHEVLYKAYGWLGRIPEAQEHILTALKFQPNNEEYQRDTKYYFGYSDPGIEGWMTYPDLKWLNEQGAKYETFIEVGSWAGRSSHAILSGNKGTVWCVDTWKGSKETYDMTNSMAKERDMLEVFKKNVGHFSNLNIVQKPSIEAAKDFADKSVDIVFIDAGHTYEEVLQDIDAWLPKAKKILCGHDYLRAWVLNTYGGIFLDADQEILPNKNFDDLLHMK